jgi:8-oxo-dGTP pyrophosphatase MutT (NUDIX family)
VDQAAGAGRPRQELIAVCGNRIVGMTDISVVPIDRLELAYSREPWPFASQRRDDIDAHFASLQRKKPALWNGRVLLLHECAIIDRVFCGSYLETDFASFLAWRDWDFPDPSVRNCFAMGALRAADGAFLLGVMGPQTANAGLIYFPSGTPDPTDIVGDRVDLERSVLREVAEETGLTAADFTADPGWVTVLAGPRVAQMKLLQSRMEAEALRAHIRDHLAAEKEPELSDIRIVRRRADFDPMMPPFMTAFLSYIWGEGAGR